MIGYIIVLLLLSSGSVFFSLYNKKYEESLPLTFGAITIFLYIFYILNILYIGYYLLLGIIGILYGYFIYSFIKSKEKKKIINNLITPGSIIFLFCFIIILFIVKGREVLLWDELRLWGIYPKILFYDGSLQLGKAATLLEEMQSYEPGMPLFQFFILKSRLKFVESTIFLAYALFGLAPLVSFTKKLTFKKWYYIPVFSILFVIIPLALANSQFDSMSYYYTLYIEPMIGIYFGYTLYLSTKDMQDKYHFITFIIALCSLVLLKDTGIIFASISILSFFINQKKKESPKVFKKKLFYYLIPLLTCILLFISWKGVQKIYQTDNMYSSKMRQGEITTFFTHMSKEQKQILKDFHYEALQKSYDSNFDRVERYFNFYTVFLLIIIGFLYIIYLQKKKEKVPYKISTICYIIGSIIYQLGTLGLFLFSLHIVVCFQRYSIPVLSAGILFIVFYLIETCLEEKKDTIPLLVFTLLFFVVATPIKSPYLNYSLQEAAEESKVYSEKISKNVKPEESIVTIFGLATLENLDGVIYHHHIYMNEIDEGFGYIPMIILDDNENNEHPVLYTQEELNEILPEYDYLYFIVVKEEDKEQFSNLLNMDIQESVLLRNKKGQELEIVK